MATKMEIERALRAADAAGDEAAARKLAAQYRNMPDDTSGTYTQAIQSAMNKASPLAKAGQVADDALRLGSNALTFGARDKYAHFLGGGTPEEERQKTLDAKMRGGSGGSAVEVAGGLPLAAAMPEIAPAMANQFTNPVAKTAAALAGGALEGSAFGSLNAAFGDKPVVKSELEGSASGAFGQAASGLINKGLSMFTKNPARLSVDDLRGQKNLAYDEVGRIGAEYTPGTVRGVLADVDNATSTAYPGLHDRVIGTRDNMRRRIDTGNPVSLTEMDANRQIINRDVTRLSKESFPAQGDMGVDMVNAMDDNLRNVGPLGVTARSGDPADAADAIERARGLNSRMEKLSQLDDSMAKASRKARRNIATGEDSTMRANIDTILGNPKLRKGYTPDELAQMETIVNGTGMQQTLRQAGRMAPGGSFLYPAMATAGATGFKIGGPMLGTVAAGAVPVTGMLAKKASQRSTMRSVEDLLDLVSSGGNKAAITKAPAMNNKTQNALARLLMLDALPRPYQR